MVVGGLLGFGGAALPVIEPTILASVIVLGLAIAFALRPPLALACAVIALFGVAHGYAHGLEGRRSAGCPMRRASSSRPRPARARPRARLAAGALGRPALSARSAR